MTNWPLNGAILLELAVAAIIVYVPYLQLVLGTRFIAPQWWVAPLPFVVFIFIYDELRKLIIRRRPGGWVERNTYY